MIFYFKNVYTCFQVVEKHKEFKETKETYYCKFHYSFYTIVFMQKVKI